MRKEEHPDDLKRDQQLLLDLEGNTGMYQQSIHFFINITHHVSPDNFFHSQYLISHEKVIYYSYIHAISSFILKDYISQASDKILDLHSVMNSCQTHSSSCNCFTLQKKKIMCMLIMQLKVRVELPAYEYCSYTPTALCHN